MSYELVSGPDWLSLSSTGLLSGTPTNDEVGERDVTVRVIDSGGLSDQGTFKVTIENVNDAPELDTLPDQTIDEDASFRYQLSATDIDLDISDESLSYELVSGPDWLSLSSTGLLSGTPTNDEVGERDVTVRVIDSGDLSDQGTFKITVENVNDAPELEAIPDQSVFNSSFYSYQLSATDVDITDEILSYELVSAPDWLSLSSTGLLSGTPINADLGVYDVIVRAVDRDGLFDEQSFTLLQKREIYDGPNKLEITSFGFDEQRDENFVTITAFGDFADDSRFYLAGLILRWARSFWVPILLVDLNFLKRFISISLLENSRCEVSG